MTKSKKEMFTMTSGFTLAIGLAISIGVKIIIPAISATSSRFAYTSGIVIACIGILGLIASIFIPTRNR
jgi:hypothetical protein